MRERERLAEEPLYLACTRPAMVAGLGIPLEAAMLCIVVGSLCMIFLGLLWALVGVAMILLCREIVKYDYNAFRLIIAWTETKARASLNRQYWGGSSATPLRLRRKYSVKDWE